ncbi:DNA gyrase inhibitor YacG [bacterium]|nr:DNA gyrase inhibitor YacG [bacterium]
MKKLTCPTCGAEVKQAGGEYPVTFPFCSDRCRNVDLNGWFTEAYSVPVETNRVVEQAMDEINQKRSDPKSSDGTPFLN